MKTDDLKTANENPWYILMTLHGEQEGDGVDWELAEKNRKLWNAWTCHGLTEEERVEAAKSSGIDVAETEWTAEIEKDVQDRFAAEFKRRNDVDRAPDLPDPRAVIDLSNIIYSNQFVTRDVIFGSGSSFFDATFEQTASFSRATFMQDVNFSRISFRQNANFFETTFMRHVEFSQSTFTQDANFLDATFTQTASFFRTTFEASASFYGTTFTKPTSFYFVIFTQIAHFENATFKQNAFFESATFTQTASFFDATFEGVAGFGHSTFAAEPSDTPEIDFSGVQMNGPVNFERATFKHQYPKLTNATLHKSVQVTADKDHWPKLASIQNHREAKEATAKLRHAMGQQALPEEEHFFFRREMQSAQRSDRWWRVLHIEFFDVLSEFGYSIARPVGWLFAVWALGALVYAKSATLSWSVGTSMAYSFSAMFKFFGFQRTFMLEETENLVAGYEIIAACQTIAGFVLLFFLGLGLRTRFRLR